MFDENKSRSVLQLTRENIFFGFKFSYVFIKLKNVHGNKKM